MSEIIRSKAYNGRQGKIYAENDEPQQPLFWWREARPTEDGFTVVRINFDFDKAGTETALTEAPSEALGNRVVPKEEALARLNHFEKTMEAYGYKPLPPEAVQKAEIPALTA